MTEAVGVEGRDRRRYATCGAKTKQREGLCTRPAGWGTGHVGFGHCKLHGGNTRSQVQKARQDMATEALKGIWNPNADPVTDSVGEMQRLAGSMREAVDKLGARMETEELDLDSPAALAWVRVLRELRTILAEMERLGIAQRHVELAQAQAELVMGGLVAVLELLKPEAEVRDRAVSVFLQAVRPSSPVVRGEVES